MDKYGADVLRLWLASGEFTGDIRVGATVLESVGKVYRNLRNRLRMLLGCSTISTWRQPCRASTCRARPSRDRGGRRARAQRHGGLRSVRAARRLFGIVAFDAEDLSSFYIDVLKDPMYSGARRRSAPAQRANGAAAHPATLTALLAPILSFTAEEVWQIFPSGCAEARPAPSTSHGRSARRTARDEDRLALWSTLKALRATVAAAKGCATSRSGTISRRPASSRRCARWATICGRPWSFRRRRWRSTRRR